MTKQVICIETEMNQIWVDFKSSQKTLDVRTKECDAAAAELEKLRAQLSESEKARKVAEKDKSKAEEEMITLRGSLLVIQDEWYIKSSTQIHLYQE